MEPPPPPTPTAQINCTDPASRIMKAGSGAHFEPAYNAQAAVEVNTRLIVGQRVSQAPNDKEQLIPTLNIVAAGLTIKEGLVDSGFVSEAAVQTIEHDAHGHRTGRQVLAPGGSDQSVDRGSDCPALRTGREAGHGNGRQPADRRFGRSPVGAR